MCRGLARGGREPSPRLLERRHAFPATAVFWFDGAHAAPGRSSIYIHPLPFQRTDVSGNTSTRGCDFPRPTRHLMALQVRRTRTPVNVCECRFHAIARARLHGCSRTAYRCSRAEFRFHNSHPHRYHRSPQALSHPTSNAHHKEPHPLHPDRALPSFQHPDPARLPQAR